MKSSKTHYYYSLTVLWMVLLLNQEEASRADSDSNCLTQLHASFLNPNPSALQNWSKPFFSNPCFNGFSSHISGITCNNGRVYHLSLPGMSLGGSLSPALSDCSDLQSLDLSRNSLSGPIPDSLKDLANLVSLNLSRNSLSGPIPPSLYLCAYLNVIDLHANLLSGPIPSQLALLNRLSTFDVSDNRLSGLIPPSLANRTGALAKFNASAFQGNKDLFGYTLQPYSNRDRGLSVVAIVGIGLASGLLSLIVSFAIVCVWLKLSEHRLAAAEEAKISHLMPDY